jgi:hypothetical protein
VKEIFEKHGCKLLMPEDEFNLKPRKVKEKYKYIAQCKHNHEVWFAHFKQKLQGLICPKCSTMNASNNKKEKYRLNPILMNDLEYYSLVYFKTLIGDAFDVKFNGEGCLSDCCIKPKNIIEDSWLMVQMKTTSKSITDGYKFKCSPKYKNCIIICICECDKKMWMFDGNTITTNSISIGLIKSKNDKFEITKYTIHEKITQYYNTFPKYDFETTDIPISPQHKIEREYSIYRETMITFLIFIRNERQGLVYDFIVNGFKVQEKVRSQTKNKKFISFPLDKKNSSINGVTQSISYKKGDNDFYWLNVNNKTYFYVIPEHELINRNYINMDKQTAIALTPNSKIGNNSWANEYLFDYTKVDEEKLKRMFGL